MMYTMSYGRYVEPQRKMARRGVTGCHLVRTCECVSPLPRTRASAILPDFSPGRSVRASRVGGMSLIQAKRMFGVLHFKDSSSIPESAFVAHFHWVFHCVIPESQLSGALARR